MTPVKFSDHPDIVGGIKWSELELKFITDRDDAWKELLNGERTENATELEATIEKLTKERDCWMETAEMLQHQNDAAFAELHQHIEEQETTIADQVRELERLVIAVADHVTVRSELRQQLAASQARASQLREALHCIATSPKLQGSVWADFAKMSLDTIAELGVTR